MWYEGWDWTFDIQFLLHLFWIFCWCHYHCFGVIAIWDSDIWWMGPDGTSIGKISAISPEMEVTNHIFFPWERTSWPFPQFSWWFFLVQKVPCKHVFPAHFHTSAAASLQFGSGLSDHWSPPQTSLLNWRCSQTWSPTTSCPAPVLKEVVGKALWPCWWRCQHDRRVMTFLRFERLSFLWKKRTVPFLFGKEEKVPVWVRYFLRTGRVFHGFPLLIQWQPAGVKLCKSVAPGAAGPPQFWAMH